MTIRPPRQVTRRTRRMPAIVVAMLLPVGVLGLAACSDGESATPNAQWTKPADGTEPTYTFEVPYGTSVKIDQGQQVDLMPQRLDVTVGESIRIVNRDGRDYMIGPFYVSAGQTLDMQFTQPGVLSGVCDMNPEGEFTINVAEA